MGLSEQDVEFKALDGTVLRGTLYPISGRGPAIVMTPGVSQKHARNVGRDDLGALSS